MASGRIIRLPRISVVLPLYNRARCVKRAIDSVLAQDLADFELLIVDDGSTDGSAEVVAEVRDPRVRLIRLERNIGGNGARNVGIREAAAPLIAFLDSDDEFLPTKLATTVRAFDERPELDLLVDSYRVQHPDGPPDERRINKVVEGEAFVEALFLRKLWKATPAISARREAVLRAGLFDEQLRRRQDFDFLARAARVAHCAASDEVTWVKHWSPGAISAQADVYIEATIALCRKHPEYTSNSRLCDGLARDLARHFSRSMRARRWSGSLRDLKLLQRQFGTAQTARLLSRGWREANRRKRAKAALRREGELGSGLEADRSRG